MTENEQTLRRLLFAVVSAIDGDVQLARYFVMALVMLVPGMEAQGATHGCID